MRVIVFVKATKDSEQGFKPSAEMSEMLEAMGKYNEELVKAGIMEAGEGLHESSKGKRIAFNGANRTVKDGPFGGDPNDLVAGFWIWKVKDMAEAVTWAKRCPNPMPGPSELEIRPIMTMEDLGDAVTPEIAAQEEKLRKQTQGC